MVHGGARSTPVSACSIPRSDIQDRRSCTTRVPSAARYHSSSISMSTSPVCRSSDNVVKILIEC